MFFIANLRYGKHTDRLWFNPPRESTDILKPELTARHLNFEAIFENRHNYNRHKKRQGHF